MFLTHENYHSIEANRAFMSVSQYKNFSGSLGMPGCEARALALVNGEWVFEPTPSMIMSSYVDAHFAGTLDVFCAKNSKVISKKDGEIKAAFERAKDIIQRCESDDYFMKFMSGKTQVIMTADLFGCTWKIAIDSYLKDIAIVDLKVMKSLNEAHYAKDYGYMPFVTYYGYDAQGAIYQKVVEINDGKSLPFFIAGASKEKYPDIEIIGVDDSTLDNAMREIEANLPRILKIKAGEIEPDRCGQCDYCRATKVLSKPIHFSELIQKI